MMVMDEGAWIHRDYGHFIKGERIIYKRWGKDWTVTSPGINLFFTPPHLHNPLPFYPGQNPLWLNFWVTLSVTILCILLVFRLTEFLEAEKSRHFTFFFHYSSVLLFFYSICNLPTLKLLICVIFNQVIIICNWFCFRSIQRWYAKYIILLTWWQYSRCWK